MQIDHDRLTEQLDKEREKAEGAERRMAELTKQLDAAVSQVGPCLHHALTGTQVFIPFCDIESCPHHHTQALEKRPQENIKTTKYALWACPASGSAMIWPINKSPPKKVY